MNLLKNRTKETRPHVVTKNDKELVTRWSNRTFYRVFPETQKDVQFLQSLETHVDKFAPAADYGDGVFVSCHIINDKTPRDESIELTLPVISPEKARAEGYMMRTNSISADTEQKIILSIQRTMAGTDAVWVADIDHTAHGTRQISVMLASKTPMIKSEK